MNEAATSATAWVWIKNILYGPAVLIGLSTESYMILTVFMAADLVLGVTRAIYIGGGQAFKSYKLTAGVVSKLLVLAVPLIVVWAGRGAGVDLTMLGQGAIGILVLSQAYSMLGHINAIRSKEDKSEWDAVSFLLRKFRTMLEQLIIDGHNKEKP